MSDLITELQRLSVAMLLEGRPGAKEAAYRAIAEIKRLRAALQPFAAANDRIADWIKDSDGMEATEDFWAACPLLRAGDFRKAKEVLG